MEFPKKRNLNWNDKEIYAVIFVWKDYILDLKTNKRNAHIYVKMSDKLKTLGFNRSAKDCQHKIKNLQRDFNICIQVTQITRLIKMSSSRYGKGGRLKLSAKRKKNRGQNFKNSKFRRETAESNANGTPSKWRFYKSIHKVLTSTVRTDAASDETVEMHEMPDWLTTDPLNPGQATCSCCQVVIKARKSDIFEHAETPVHKANFIKLEPGDLDSFSEEPWVPVETVMALSPPPENVTETITPTLITPQMPKEMSTQTIILLPPIINGSSTIVPKTLPSAVPNKAYVTTATQTTRLTPRIQTPGHMNYGMHWNPFMFSGEESCYSFGGGHVYPQETSRSTGHSLHWSKAQISKPAPDWEGTAVVKGEFKEIKLADFRGKYVVFFFYPLDFTFVCPTEIVAFSDRVKEFHAISTEVIACSVDSPFTHLAWINTPRKVGGLGPINIPILSDLTHQISKDYGVFLQDLGHTLRGLFIIDDKGVLRQITMNDLPVGRSVDETLRLVQAFQYTDKFGEVCPAGWKPGSETIIPNPADKLKYFGKVNE